MLVPLTIMIAVSEEELPEEVFPEMDNWLEYGLTLAVEQSPIQWRMGQWLVTGEKLYGNKAYWQAELLTGYNRAALRKFVLVTEQVRLRNEELSWSHHLAVAHLSPEKQSEWLTRALVGNLSVRDLQASIKCQEPKTDTESRSASGIRNIERSLVLLAKSRRTTTASIKQIIFEEYLKHPDLVVEVQAAQLTARNVTARNRMTGLEKWQRYIVRTVEDLLSRLSESGSSTTEPSDFVAMWERETNRKFSRRVFVHAMRHSELKAHFAGLSSEDFGLNFDPPLHIRHGRADRKRTLTETLTHHPENC